MRFKVVATVFVLALPAAATPHWGFFGHQKINRLAVFTLPVEMIGFYKANVKYLEDASVNPDKRRYAVEDEAARHYLDLDHYGDSALSRLPREWTTAVGSYSEDSLKTHGILPWHIFRMYRELRDAFMVRDPSGILRISAELGHYIADAHVPLHTTRNYNGQLTGQDGIHGFWESRLPEIFFPEYDFFVGRAAYVDDPRGAAWGVVGSTHQLVAQVLDEEKKLAQRFGERKYSFETRGNTTVKVYAIEYAKDYHNALRGMVERQMRGSVKTIGDFWYTAWIDAGQPDLRQLIDNTPDAETLRHNRQVLDDWKAGRAKIRPHE